MLRSLKHCSWVLCLAASLHSALGFSLLGPIADTPEADWQVPEIGYNLPGDIGGPKNLGEEFRWNTPFVYYGFEASFLDYFGSNGVFAIEQAFAILNGLTNVSSYSADLSEFPLEVSHVNYQAEIMHLLDLKSVALQLIVEELGLTESDRYIWTLRDRGTQPNLACPFMDYTVIQRSFDPVTFEPSSYLNGVLFSYVILEDCGQGGPPDAVTVPFPVDPMGQDATAVTSLRAVAGYGRYLTGLSRDDVGGLRYLLRPSNVNWESISRDSVLFATNTTQARPIYTSNLTLFAQQAMTTNAAGLIGLYPDLQITGSTNYPVIVSTTNLTPYFVTYPFDPVGTPPHIAFLTNVTLSVELRYQHSFGNLVTFSSTPAGLVTVPIVTLTPHIGRGFVTLQTLVSTNGSSPWNPAGSGFPVTNIYTRTFLTNEVVGDFAILPTNSCGFMPLFTLLTNVFSTTNLLTSTNAFGTNTPPVGGGGTTTNTTAPDFVAQYLIQYFTNHVYWGYDVDCVSSNAMLRQGIDHIEFRRADYDSLLGRFFHPITNTYNLIGITNDAPVLQTVQRVVVRPDYIFRARDGQGTPALDDGGMAWRITTEGNFNIANVEEGLGGPGNIEPNMQITFTKVGPMLDNSYSPTFVMDGLSQSTAIANWTWGSYDGSPNPPIVYPQGATIRDMESQIIFQVVTPPLPEGNVGIDYNVPLVAAGSQPPYSWAFAEGSPRPAGLDVTSDGRLAGTPGTAGTFLIIVRATETGGRTASQTLSLTIRP